MPKHKHGRNLSMVGLHKKQETFIMNNAKINDILPSPKMPPNVNNVDKLNNSVMNQSTMNCCLICFIIML